MDKQIVEKFKNAFNFKPTLHSRGIGIECEIPITTHEGNAVELVIIQEMFSYLGKEGFELERDDFSGLITAAVRSSQKKSGFAYCKDTITTDTGFSTVEVVLAPHNNLHDIQVELSKLLALLITFFDSRNCLMLGYGIQPVTPPSAKLLMPKERYSFFKKFSTNYIIPKSEGADSDLLNVTASNQCHIQVDSKEAIIGTNVLNALSGLQIALHANSPIWQGRVDAEGKANRELLWDSCFPDRLNQVGVPPKFESLDEYVAYLLNFKPLLVKRGEKYLQIINKETVKDFLLDKKVPAIGETLNGKKRKIIPRVSDMDELIPFSWYNARLVPKYGTLENRMCCQQPPKETLTSTALTLGLLENLEAAQVLAATFSLDTWRKIRLAASRATFEASIDGKSIIPLISRLLDIAKEGLISRGLGEEIFLAPLYTRLTERKAPADVAIAIFEQEGMDAFLNHVAFNLEDYPTVFEESLEENTLLSPTSTTTTHA